MSGQQPYKKTHVIHSRSADQPAQPVNLQAIAIQPIGAGVTYSPAPGAVTSDILTQLQAGIPPSNDQVTEVLETTSEFLESKQREPNLSARTRKTMADVNNIVRDCRQFVEEKNPDETLQSMFIQGKVAAESMAVKVGTGAFGSTASEGFDVAGDLAKLLVQSSEFRGLLLDLTDLIQSVVFITEHQKSSPPQQQQHQQLQLSGQEVELEGSRTSLPPFDSSAASVFSSPGTGSTTTTSTSYTRVYNPPAYVPTTTGFLPVNTSTATYYELQPSTATTTTALRDSLQRYSPTSTSSRISSSNGGQSGTIRETSSFTEEEKRKLRAKLSRTLINISNHEDYRKGLEGLMHLGGILKKEVNDIIYNRPISTDPNVMQFMSEAKTFLQRFSGEHTIDKLLEDIKSFLRVVMDDPLLNRYFDELSDFFQQLVERPHSIIDDSSFVRKTDDMMNRGLNLLSSTQQHPYLGDILREARLILNAIRDDPLRRKLAADMKVLAADFVTYGKDGKPVLNTELVSQLKTLMIPLLTEHLKEIPVPRITGSNDTYDYWIDNLTFSAGELLPNQLHLHIDSDSDINVKTLSTQRSVTRILLTARGIRTTMNDIQFWFKRKSFPRTEDEGFATVEVNGERGASVLIQITFCPERHVPFDVHAVRFHIDDLNIEISETRHDWLYNMFTNMYKKSIKEKVEEEVQRNLRAIIFKMNHQMNLLFSDAKHSVTEMATNMLMAGGKVIQATSKASGITAASNLLTR